MSQNSDRRQRVSEAERSADKLLEFVSLVRAEDETTVGTSVRLPTSVRDAAILATELGYVKSTSDLVVHGIRDQLDGMVWRAALDAHYETHPEDRPGLATVAQAAAEQYGSPLADEPDLIERAAAWVEKNHPAGDFDDVLLVAEGMLLAR